MLLLMLTRIPFAEEVDNYIVISFVNATLVLSIGETVEEVTDTGFAGNVATLSASRIGDDSLLQVVERFHGLRRPSP